MDLLTSRSYGRTYNTLVVQVPVGCRNYHYQYKYCTYWVLGSQLPITFYCRSGNRHYHQYIKLVSLPGTWYQVTIALAEHWYQYHYQ